MKSTGCRRQGRGSLVNAPLAPLRHGRRLSLRRPPIHAHPHALPCFGGGFDGCSPAPPLTALDTRRTRLVCPPGGIPLLSMHHNRRRVAACAVVCFGTTHDLFWCLQHLRLRYASCAPRHQGATCGRWDGDTDAPPPRLGSFLPLTVGQECARPLPLIAVHGSRLQRRF